MIPIGYVYVNNEGHRCFQFMQGLMDLEYWTETPVYKGVTDVEHARNQALEDAAQEADKWFPVDSAAKYPTGGIAAAIRAMKSQVHVEPAKRVEVVDV